MTTFSENPNLYFRNEKAKGPLAKLYENPYDFTNRYYPRNLGSETRGHYINFYINVAEQSSYIAKNRYTVYDFAGRSALNASTQNIASVSNITGENEEDSTIAKVANLVTKRKTKRIKQAIALYMPETMNVEYNADWQSSSLTEAGGRPLALAQGAIGISDTIKNQIKDFDVKTLASDPTIVEAASAISGLNESARDFLFYAAGSAINPQLQVLFKGVDFRRFQFDFLFAPFDESEARNVEEIIKTFRFHLAPEVNVAKMGRYFVPPSEFDIDFLFNGQINEHVHQVGTCVLTNINVDYAPNGISTFTNGMPTHTRMTLQFMETEIVTKQRVDEDNY